MKDLKNYFLGFRPRRGSMFIETEQEADGSTPAGIELKNRNDYL